MEPRVSPSRAEADEVDVTTIYIRVHSSTDCIVTPCEPTVTRGGRVTFVLTDVGRSFTSATVTIHPSAPRPLLLDTTNGTKVDKFELTPNTPQRTFEISSAHPPHDPDEPRFFAVDAVFGSVEVEVLRAETCFSADNEPALHGHVRPRMIVLLA